MSQYSHYGSDILDSKIDAMLEIVKVEFQKVFSPEDLKALILGGGYGRGEGGVRFDNGDEFPYNDLDFFVISRDLPHHRKISYQRILTDLHHRLTEQCGMDIDFSPIQPIRVLPQAPFWLVWYELKYGNKVVLGNPRVLDYLPRWQDKDVPIFEAVKLLLNRGVGLWKAKQVLAATNSPVEIDFVIRNIHKAVQAIGDSLLMVAHQYHWSNLERMRRSKNVFASLNIVDEYFERLYTRSMEFKLKPTLNPVPYFELEQEIKTLIPLLIQVYYYVWAVLTSNPNINSENLYREIQTYSIAHLNNKSIPKNFALNVKEFRLSAFSYEMYCQYPRHRLICALPWFLGGVEDTNFETDYLLGLPPGSDSSLRQRKFIELWEKYN